jgi:hypothetical protein
MKDLTDTECENFQVLTFHRLNVSPFLKGQGPTYFPAAVLLVCAWEQRMRH